MNKDVKQAIIIGAILTVIASVSLTIFLMKNLGW